MDTTKKVLLILIWGTCAMLGWGCAAWSYLGYRISPDYPGVESGTVELDGLEAPVRVVFDDLGVPHVDAASEHDLLRTVGYLHGRERFFQMDTVRRYARGRLSELVGERRVPLGSTVDLDRAMRSWGFDHSCQREAEELEPGIRALMTAYTEGVNAALARHPPIEYRLLGVEPEPWTIADSFAVGSMIAWGITHNWRQELCRLLLALHGGIERAERIYPNRPWPGDTSLHPQGDPHPLPPAVVPEMRTMFARPLRAEPPPAGRTAAGPVLPLPEFIGASNGWVIGGARSASGASMLVNDPHLPHMLPSIMFQQHVRCPAYEVIGVTVAGLPYVLIGHNRKVAWGMTSAVADVLDLYIERPDPNDPGRVLGPAGPEPLEQDEVIIRIRDGSDLRVKRLTVRRTRRGPVLNDMFPGLLPDAAPLVTIRGGRLGAGASMQSLGRAAAAGTVGELRAAMLGMASPINVVQAADTSGAVTLFATGEVPQRPNHLGTFPVPAWVPAYQWGPVIAQSQMPHATGGPGDFFAHANNLMFDPARAPVLFQVDSGPSYRRDRIVQLIEATPEHTIDSHAAIQGDVLLLRAGRVLPKMLDDLRGLRGRMPCEERSLWELHNWDLRAGADAVAATVFFTTYRRAIILAVEDEVDRPALEYLLSERYFTNAADGWYDDPHHPVWDDLRTDGTETRADVVRAAFRQAVGWLRVTLGGEGPAEWRWGRLHDMVPRHAFGGKVPAFNLPRWEAPGGLDSVWKAHFDLGHPRTPFRANYGPVFRMIVDLADMDHAHWIIDTGASGWPGSPHYDDQHAVWKRLDLAPMVMDWDELTSTAAAVMTLK